MHDLDRIEYVCREIDRGIVSHDYIKTLLAYARRALAVERGMIQKNISCEWDGLEFIASTDLIVFIGASDSPFVAVEALLNAKEPTP